MQIASFFGLLNDPFCTATFRRIWATATFLLLFFFFWPFFFSHIPGFLVSPILTSGGESAAEWCVPSAGNIQRYAGTQIFACKKQRRFSQHDFDYMILRKCSNTCHVFCKLSIGNHAGIGLHTTGLEWLWFLQRKSSCIACLSFSQHDGLFRSSRVAFGSQAISLGSQPTAASPSWLGVGQWVIRDFCRGTTCESRLSGQGTSEAVVTQIQTQRWGGLGSAKVEGENWDFHNLFHDVYDFPENLL